MASSGDFYLAGAGSNGLTWDYSANTLTIDGDYISATIYDIFGKIILNTDYQNTIDVATLSNGIYFIHINTNNAITVKKITIAK